MSSSPTPSSQTSSNRSGCSQPHPGRAGMFPGTRNVILSGMFQRAARLWKRRSSLVPQFGPAAVFCTGHDFGGPLLLWLPWIPPGLTPPAEEQCPSLVSQGPVYLPERILSLSFQTPSNHSGGNGQSPCPQRLQKSCPELPCPI